MGARLISPIRASGSPVYDSAIRAATGRIWISDCNDMGAPPPSLPADWRVVWVIFLPAPTCTLVWNMGSAVSIGEWDAPPGSLRGISLTRDRNGRPCALLCGICRFEFDKTAPRRGSWPSRAPPQTSKKMGDGELASALGSDLRRRKDFADVRLGARIRHSLHSDSGGPCTVHQRIDGIGAHHGGCL